MNMLSDVCLASDIYFLRIFVTREIVWTVIFNNVLMNLFNAHDSVLCITVLCLDYNILLFKKIQIIFHNTHTHTHDQPASTEFSTVRHSGLMAFLPMHPVELGIQNTLAFCHFGIAVKISFGIRVFRHSGPTQFDRVMSMVQSPGECF